MHSKLTKKECVVPALEVRTFFNPYFDDFSFPALLGPIFEGKVAKTKMPKKQRKMVSTKKIEKTG